VRRTAKSGGNYAKFLPISLSNGRDSQQQNVLRRRAAGQKTGIRKRPSAGNTASCETGTDKKKGQILFTCSTGLLPERYGSYLPIIPLKKGKGKIIDNDGDHSSPDGITAQKGNKKPARRPVQKQ